MLSKTPLVSIVIATYNRYEYLYDCVDSIRSIDSDDLEIIIQDNTEDNKAFAEYISSLNDDRIKYSHKKEHVSVVDNYDMGIIRATGDYVCLIGDDDSICSNILKAASYLKENNIEGCTFPFPGFYWPDMNFKKGEKKLNLFYRFNVDGSVFDIDAKKELLKGGCRGSLSDYMPRLYHAMVSRNCLERIYKKTGTYFPGPSPDMANAVSVCLEIDKAVYINDNLIISGYGNASARGQSKRGQHFGKIEDMPWLPKDTKENWDKNLPPIFSGETIFAQSAISALKKMNTDKNKFQFDYTSVYANFFYQHKATRLEFLKFISLSPRRTLWFVQGVYSKVVRRIIKRVKVEPTYKELYDIATLMEAKEITEQISENIQYKRINNNG